MKETTEGPNAATPRYGGLLQEVGLFGIIASIILTPVAAVIYSTGVVETGMLIGLGGFAVFLVFAAVYDVGVKLDAA